MEPPTCTVLVRVVRTTAAVATELLPPDDEAGLLWLALLAATATPPATAPRPGRRRGRRWPRPVWPRTQPLAP